MVWRGSGIRWDAPLDGGVSVVFLAEKTWMMRKFSHAKVWWKIAHSRGKGRGETSGAIPGTCRIPSPLEAFTWASPFPEVAIVGSTLLLPSCLLHSSSSFKTQLWHIPTSRNPMNFLLPEILWTSFSLTWLAIYLTCSESILYLTLIMLFCNHLYFSFLYLWRP